MSKLIIKGSSRLNGEIAVSGAKNAAMKMIAACVLIKDKVVLENVPDILDIQTMIDILAQNGAEISRDRNVLIIDTTNLRDDDPDTNLVRKMRGSIVLVGPYLARFGRINLAQPGGCAIGARPIDDHLHGFRQLDVEISECDNVYHFQRSELKGGNVNIRPSVTATENLIMAQVLALGKTIIHDVAREPQIADLANFLNQAGSKVTGAGTANIEIEGVEKLHGLSYTVMPDPFEAATFICLAVATKSPLRITNCEPKHLYPFLDKLAEIGVDFETGSNYVEIKKVDFLKPSDIMADVYPAFSTDMQAPMGLILTQANGESHITEKLFENRLGYLSELEKMGAKVEIINNHEAIIYGPTKLHGAKLESLDLRAGATMILAGAIADGITEIDEAQIIDRGYEKIETKLSKIGVDIKRIS